MDKHFWQNFPLSELQVSIPTMYYGLWKNSQKFQSWNLAAQYELSKSMLLQDLNHCTFRIKSLWILEILIDAV